MTRNWDWPERLTDVILSYQDRKFVYSESDCCCFVRDCIMAVAGWNFMHGFRMRYKTERGALGEIVRYGKVSTVAELAASRLGDPIEVLKAQRGDVVIVPPDAMQAIGIVVGSEVLFMQIESGLTRVKVSSCDTAWRV